MSSYDFMDIYSEVSPDRLRWLGTPISTLLMNGTLNTTSGTYHFKAPTLAFTMGTSLMSMFAEGTFYSV